VLIFPRFAHSIAQPIEQLVSESALDAFCRVATFEPAAFTYRPAQLRAVVPQFGAIRQFRE
jgi:hypothetical protein